MGEANDTANRMIKTGEGKAPTLTLDPDEVKYDMSFMEPSLKKNMPAEMTFPRIISYIYRLHTSLRLAEISSETEAIIQISSNLEKVWENSAVLI